MEAKEIKIAEILRKTTMIVKLSPFVYTALLALCMVSYYVLPDRLVYLMDELCYVSPIMIVSFIGLSYALKMCVWHRLQCCLPLLPMGVSLVDDYVLELSNIAAVLNLVLVALLCVLSIYNGIKIFTRK